MSHDPSSPSDAADAAPDNACPFCGTLDCSPVVEAFEIYGDVMCDVCFEIRQAGDAEAADAAEEEVAEGAA